MLVSISKNAMLEEIIKQIDWSEGFYKGAFFIVACVMIYAVYHGVKFFGKRFLALFDAQNKQLKELTDISVKLDTKIELVIQDQKNDRERFERHEKYTNERFVKSDKHIDLMLQSLLKATQR